MKYIRHFLLILIIIVLSTLSIDAATDTDRTAYKTAKSLIYKKNWQKAITSFNSFMRQHPESKYSAEAHYWLAYCIKRNARKLDEESSQIREYKKAFAKLQVLIRKYPRSKWIDDAKLLRLEIAEELVDLDQEEYEKYIVDDAKKDIDWESIEALESLRDIKGLENLPEFIANISEWGKNTGVDVARDVLEGVKDNLPEGLEIVKKLLTGLKRIPGVDAGIDEALKELDSIEYIDGLDEALRSLKSVRKLKILKDKKGRIKIKGIDEALEALGSMLDLGDLEKSLENIERVRELKKRKDLSKEEREELRKGLKAMKDLDKTEKSLKRIKDLKGLQDFEYEDTLADLEFEVDLKLVALESLLQKDKKRALPLLKKMMKENKKPEFKEKAVLVLGQTNDPMATKMLQQIVEDEEEDEEIRQKALFFLQAKKGHTLPELRDIYKKSKSRELKGSVLESIARFDNDLAVKYLIEIYKKEKDQRIKRGIISGLGRMKSKRAGKFLESIIKD